MSLTKDSSSSQELTISGLLLVLKRRRSFIMWTTVFCVSAAILLCLFMTPKYKATGEIQVAKQSSDELGLDGMKGDGGGVADALEGNIELQTQANILKSDTLALKVIENLDLEHTKDFQPIFNPIAWALNLFSPQGPKDPPHASLENSPRRRGRLLGVFAGRLKVQPMAGTELIDISFLHSDPKIAAAVVNELSNSLVDYTFQTRFTATNVASKWLGGQMADLKKQAEDLQAKVVQLQREAGVYSLGTADASGKELAFSATLDRLQQATEALAQATSNRILKGGIYQMAKSGDPEMISGLAGTSLSGTSSGTNNAFNLLQTLRGQQAAIETQLAADTSKYGSANPKLGDERASLAGTTAAINQEIKRIGGRAKTDYRAAQIPEKGLRKDYDRQRASADQLNNKAVKYSIAKQEADESRGLYETLYQHLKAAGVVEGLRSSNVTVVDPGRVPAKPARPNVPLYLALALFGGLFLGSVGAVLLDTVDNRVQSMEIIERSLNAPLLGVIPTAVLSGSRRIAEFAPPKLTKRLTDGLSITSPSDIPVSPDASNTAFTEALGSLRTALLLSRSSAPPKVILITSAAESEGKTTVALNLAAALARNHSRVLLVEADMRCPTLEHRFSIPGEKGLSNMLSGDYDNMEVRPFAAIPDLVVISAGPTPPFPAELLGSRRMKELIDQWSAEYDFVLIDSPALLAVTDAAVLSKMADITLLVTRHAQSTLNSLERAWHTLRTDPETKVGVVLNGVSRSSAAYGEYFGYHGNAYYGEKKERVHAKA
jgi:succinoglycan biosynthesis transport protein ExoP